MKFILTYNTNLFEIHNFSVLLFIPLIMPYLNVDYKKKIEILIDNKSRGLSEDLCFFW